MSKSDSLLPLREALEGLIAKWRSYNTGIDERNAGLRCCARELEAIINDPLVSPSLEGRWQPMSTAPKDEPVIVVTKDEIVGEAWFSTANGGSCWWANTDPTEDRRGDRVSEPTFWQPLPPAPRPSAEPEA